jgi:hypothetical protein
MTGEKIRAILGHGCDDVGTISVDDELRERAGERSGDVFDAGVESTSPLMA